MMSSTKGWLVRLRFHALGSVALIFSVSSLLLVGPAHADPILLDGPNTRLDFLNWENLNVDLDSDGKLDVGDTLRGVIKVQNNAAGQGGFPESSFMAGSGNEEVLAIFELEVTGKVAVGGGAFEFTFGPHALSGLGPADSMMVVYTVPTTAVAPTTFDSALNVSVAATEAVVLGGTPFMALGYNVAAGDGYWISNANSDVVPGPIGGSAEYFYGLNVLPGFGVIAPADIVDQTNPFLSPFAPNQAPFTGFLNDFVGEGDVTPVAQGNGVDAYSIFSDDPALIKLIPEPSTFALATLALLGLVAYGHRRRRV